MQNTSAKEKNKSLSAAELYALAARHQIAVCSFPMPLAGSMAIADERGRCYIGLDPSFRGNAERVRIAHELGHCLTGGFYDRLSSGWQRRKSEYKADKWAILHLVPKEQLRAAQQQGCTEPWQLAEHFALPEEFMRQAIEYYKDGGLL